MRKFKLADNQKEMLMREKIFKKRYSIVNSSLTDSIQFHLRWMWPLRVDCIVLFNFLKICSILNRYIIACPVSEFV